MQKRSQAAADLLKFWEYLDHRGLDYKFLLETKMGFDAPPRLVRILRSRSEFQQAITDVVENPSIVSTSENK